MKAIMDNVTKYDVFFFEGVPKQLLSSNIEYVYFFKQIFLSIAPLRKARVLYYTDRVRISCFSHSSQLNKRVLHRFIL